MRKSLMFLFIISFGLFFYFLVLLNKEEMASANLKRMDSVQETDFTSNTKTKEDQSNTLAPSKIFSYKNPFDVYKKHSNLVNDDEVVNTVSNNDFIDFLKNPFAKKEQYVSQFDKDMIEAKNKIVDIPTKLRDNVETAPNSTEQQNLQSFFKSLEKRPNIFFIAANKDTMLRCKEGTIVSIKKNGFLSSKTKKPIVGNVEVFITELYNKTDMICSRLSTSTDEVPLHAHQLLKIIATSNDERCMVSSAAGHEIILAPDYRSLENKLYYGEDSEEYGVEWTKLDDIENVNQIRVFADEMPVFVGGEAGITKFVSENTNCFNISNHNKIKGTIYASIVVERDGSIKSPTILKGIDKECDNEVVKALKILPKFSPAHNKGVAVAYYLPLSFRFNDPRINEIEEESDSLRVIKDPKLQFLKVSFEQPLVYTLPTLGWLCVGRPIIDKKGDLHSNAIINESNVSSSQMVFKRENVIIEGKAYNKLMIYNNVPEQANAELLFFREELGDIQFAHRPYVKDNESIADLEFETISAVNFKSKLSGILKSN